MFSAAVDFLALVEVEAAVEVLEEVALAERVSCLGDVLAMSESGEAGFTDTSTGEILYTLV